MMMLVSPLWPWRGDDLLHKISRGRTLPQGRRHESKTCQLFEGWRPAQPVEDSLGWTGLTEGDIRYYSPAESNTFVNQTCPDLTLARIVRIDAPCRMNPSRAFPSAGRRGTPATTQTGAREGLRHGGTLGSNSVRSSGLGQQQ